MSRSNQFIRKTGESRDRHDISDLGISSATANRTQKKLEISCLSLGFLWINLTGRLTAGFMVLGRPYDALLVSDFLRFEVNAHPATPAF